MGLYIKKSIHSNTSKGFERIDRLRFEAHSHARLTPQPYSVAIFPGMNNPCGAASSVPGLDEYTRHLLTAGFSAGVESQRDDREHAIVTPAVLR